MFGQITDFSEEGFFDEHRYGNLFVNDENKGLEFFCYLDADAYDANIYGHVTGGEELRQGYLDLLHERARWWRDETAVGPSDRIALLSTCQEGATNARAILVGKICDTRFKNPFVKVPNLGTGVDLRAGLLGIPLWCWLVLVVFVVLVAVVVRERGKRSRAS